MVYDPKYESWKEDQEQYARKIRKDILAESCLSEPTDHFGREMIDIAVKLQLLHEHYFPGKNKK